MKTYLSLIRHAFLKCPCVTVQSELLFSSPPCMQSTDAKHKKQTYIIVSVKLFNQKNDGVCTLFLSKNPQRNKTKNAHELQRNNKKKAVCSLCIAYKDKYDNR